MRFSVSDECIDQWGDRVNHTREVNRVFRELRKMGYTVVRRMSERAWHSNARSEADIITRAEDEELARPFPEYRGRACWQPLGLYWTAGEKNVDWDAPATSVVAMDMLKVVRGIDVPFAWDGTNAGLFYLWPYTGTSRKDDPLDSDWPYVQVPWE